MQARINTRLLKTLKPTAKPYEVVDDQLKGFLLRVQPSGLMTYYLAYYNTQRKKKRYKIGRCDVFTPMQARDLAQELLIDIAKGHDICSVKQEIANISTLRDFLDQRYAAWLVSERKSGRTRLQKIYRNFGYLLDTPLTEIKPWVIEKWRSHADQQNKLPNTLNRLTAAMKALLSKAVEWEVIEVHPLSKLKLLKVDTNKKVRYLTQAEELRLRKALRFRDKELKAARERGNQWRKERGYPLFPLRNEFIFVDHLEPMCLISINTGLRQGELFNLTWGNIDFTRRSLTVCGDQAKSGKTRHIPLNKEALDTLRVWKNQTEKIESNLVFTSRNGARFTNVRKAWLSTLELADIQNFRWHDMRHHFASRLVMAQVDLNTVRELLGHATLAMTLRYAHLAPEHKMNAVEKLLPQGGAID